MKYWGAEEQFVPDGLRHVVGGVTWQGVMEVPDEVVSVLLRQGHECATHHDELHLVHTVAQLLQLQTASNEISCNKGEEWNKL